MVAWKNTINRIDAEHRYLWGDRTSVTRHMLMLLSQNMIHEYEIVYDTVTSCNGDLLHRWEVCSDEKSHGSMLMNQI